MLLALSGEFADIQNHKKANSLQSSESSITMVTTCLSVLSCNTL